ncbi:GntR family transcriptional regulator [Achromobacter xylosoxidans]
MNIELTDPSVENAATGCDGPALSVSERTYQALLDRIAARQIGPGEVLEERRLAEELNVSRTPMRAALNRLLGEGILKRLSNGSVVVHAFGVTELLELLQIRQLLEGQAAAMALPDSRRQAGGGQGAAGRRDAPQRAGANRPGPRTTRCTSWWPPIAATSPWPP